MIKSIGDAKVNAHPVDQLLIYKNQFLEKRIPKNKKFEHVKPKVNSGLTINKLIKKIGEQSISILFLFVFLKKYFLHSSRC